MTTTKLINIGRILEKAGKANKPFSFVQIGPMTLIERKHDGVHHAIVHNYNATVIAYDEGDPIAVEVLGEVDSYPAFAPRKVLKVKRAAEYSELEFIFDVFADFLEDADDDDGNSGNLFRIHDIDEDAMTYSDIKRASENARQLREERQRPYRYPDHEC